MKTLNSANAPAAVGPYSHAVFSNGLVFVSGTMPIDPATGTLKGTTIAEQTEQVVKNLTAVLKDANSGLEKVIKTTCFLKNIQDFKVFNEIYAKFFTNKPARSCVEVSALPKDALVEIEVVAEVNQGV